MPPNQQSQQQVRTLLEKSTILHTINIRVLHNKQPSAAADEPDSSSVATRSDGDESSDQASKTADVYDFESQEKRAAKVVASVLPASF